MSCKLCYCLVIKRLVEGLLLLYQMSASPPKKTKRQKSPMTPLKTPTKQMKSVWLAKNFVTQPCCSRLKCTEILYDF